MRHLLKRKIQQKTRDKTGNIKTRKNIKKSIN